MNFRIPNEVNNDILYCQKSLRHYIHVHQMLAANLSVQNMLDDPRLSELENEILGIGRDQKKIVDKLRLCMENYFVCLEKKKFSIDRSTANANVANQLFQNFQMCCGIVEPINVKKRLSDDELIDKYIYNRAIPGSGAINITECRNPEKKSQESLLKPKFERLATHSPKIDSDEQFHSSSSANLKSRRLNLRQVLQTKAENQILDQNVKDVKKLDSIPSPPVANKTNNANKHNDVIWIETTPTNTDINSNSSGSSSSASPLSDDTINRDDLLKGDKGKETFLRALELCTPTYRDHLIQKRSARKRRSCTSTAKRDFHYGNIDILERQSSRPNKVKSTPEPVVTKLRQTQSDSGASSVKPKPKLEIKSNSSSKYDNLKLCILCLKNANSEKILECESCNVYYHLGCNKLDEASYVHSQRIKSRYCPDCLRRQQKTREEIIADLRSK